MNASDIVADRLIARGLYLERYKAGLNRQILALMEDMEDQLTRELASAFAARVPNTSQRIRRLERLLADVRKVIRDTYRNTDELSGKELVRLAQNEQLYAAAAIHEATVVEIADVTLNYDELAKLTDGTLIEGAKSSDWWKRQAEDVTRRFSDQMRMGVARGETLDQLVRRVRGTQAKLYTDGIMQVTRRNAEALVRSSVQVIANETRQAFFRANPQVVKAIQWSSVLDGRTTVICQALHGKMWTNDAQRKPIGHDKVFPGPTAHWNCRSVQIAVLTSWNEMAAKMDDDELDDEFRKQLKEQGFSDDEIRNMKRNTRASMDGQVAADVTFDEWLNGKPTAFQDELLGPRRGKMFRDGKITLTDLIDQSGRPLTIEQLEELSQPRPKPRPVKLPSRKKG